MRQLKTPIIAVLAASILVLSNPPPAHATSSYDYRAGLQEGAKIHDYKGLSGIQLEFRNGFLELLSLHQPNAKSDLSGWSSKIWRGPSAVSPGASEEVVVATPEPSSLLELATVGLVSAGLWFWRRKNTVLQSSPLPTA